MKTIEIYWNDLTKEAQKNIQETLGMDKDDNGNWDVIPMCSFDVEDDD